MEANGNSGNQIPVPDCNLMTTNEASDRLKINDFIFRFVARAILKIRGEKVGRCHLFHKTEVARVDEYIRTVDPQGIFRSRRPKAAHLLVKNPVGRPRKVITPME